MHQLMLCSKTGKHWKTSFEKNCFSAWASTLNMDLINKVDMVCLSSNQPTKAVPWSFGAPTFTNKKLLDN